MQKKLLFAATIMSLFIVFVLGTLFGWSYGTTKLTDATRIVKEGELDSDSFLIEQDLFSTLGQRDCDLTQKRLESLGHQLYELGNILGTSTAERDLDVDNYNLLKRRFHLLQIKTYTLHYSLRQSCNTPSPIVLFYYSRNDSLSEAQGKILDEFVAKYDARVFALEYQYSKELAFLEQYYNVTRVPTLVLNYNRTFTELTSLDVLETVSGLHG